MKKRVLIVTMSTLLTPELVYAECSQASDDSVPKCATIAEPAQNIAHCKQYMFPYSLCYVNESTGQVGKFHICHVCEDGYILTLNPDFMAMGCGTGDAGIYVCQPCSVAKRCDPYSEVKYDKDAWKNSWTGYQSNSWTECNTNTCEWETRSKFRCAAGYYGNSAEITENYIEGFGVMGMNGCTRCPMNSNASKFGDSDPGENETIQDCYLIESEGSDFSGTYKIVPEGARCYHD